MDVDVQVGKGGPLATGAGAGTGAGTGAGAGAGAGVGAGVDLGVDVGVDADVNLGVDVGLDADLEGGGEVGLNPEVGLGPGLGVKPGVGPGVGVGLKPGVKPGPGTKPKPKAPSKSYPIKIAVNNVPEGPAFVPDTKNVPVSEDPNEAPEDGVITVFAAVDPDTGKPAEDVRLVKLQPRLIGTSLVLQAIYQKIPKLLTSWWCYKLLRFFNLDQRTNPLMLPSPPLG